MNVANLLVRAGHGYPRHAAVAVGGRVLFGYAELAERVARLAGGLLEGGLRRGERVALVMRNCPEYVETLLACWHAGLIAVPVNAKLHPQELRYVLEHSGARWCFATAELAAALAPLQDGLPALERLVEVGDSGYAALLQAAPVTVAAVEPSDPAWLFYTSGTTGRPKGAVLSHRNLMAMTLCYFADVDAVAPGDSILHAAPMSHGSGMYLLPHVAAAATQVIPDSGGFEPEEIFALIEQHRGVSFFAAPTMVGRLANHPAAAGRDYRNLKSIVYGGGPMYLEDCRKALSVFGQRLVQIYGQGESPMTICSLPRHFFADRDHPRYEQRLASVGLPQSAVQVMVADEEDRPLPPGEVGEVLVRGDAVMNGYWNNPEATAATLRNGWLHTGDVGAFDEDGFLTLKDRSKDVIISGGTNIYPREVEEVLLADERLAEVAVIGRRHPDWGEEVVAFCVARDGEQVGAEELDALCLARIARFKRPKEYFFVDSLPKNNYGKILKTDLRQRLAAAGGA